MSLRITNAATAAHEAQMRLLGEFMTADEIIYEDYGNKEEYTVVKGGRRLKLAACGGKEGGFLSVKELSSA